jgi:hypothetical protein
MTLRQVTTVALDATASATLCAGLTLALIHGRGDPAPTAPVSVNAAHRVARPGIRHREPTLPGLRTLGTRSGQVAEIDRFNFSDLDLTRNAVTATS